MRQTQEIFRRLTNKFSGRNPPQFGQLLHDYEDRVSHLRNKEPPVNKTEADSQSAIKSLW
jgi:hypothetical protein